MIVGTGRLSGKTALKTSQNANMSTMKLLLENGADPGVCNADGATPPDLLPKDANVSHLKQLFNEVQGKPPLRKTSKVPKAEPQCSTKRERISREFSINVWFYWRLDTIPWSRKVSVYDIVYDKTRLEKLENDYIEFLKQETQGTNGPAIERKHIWKWIHFPANNVSSLLCTGAIN
jgi:hypothetical protein